MAILISLFNLIFLFFSLIIPTKLEIPYYPLNNQYFYSISLFNQHTMHMTFYNKCDTFSLTSLNSNKMDYYWDSTANAVILFKILWMNEVLKMNCVIQSVTTTYILDLNTVDTTSSITIQRPTIDNLKAVFDNSVNWTFNPQVTITSSTNNPIALTDIRYYYYVYRYKEDIIPDTNTLVCSSGGYLTDTGIINVSCLIPDTFEGERLHVAIIAHHWYYRIKDTLSFTIIPRNDHILNKNTFSLQKLTTSGLTTSYQKRFKLAKNLTPFTNDFSSQDKSYINAIHWSCTCTDTSIITNNCSIDKSGLFFIKDISLVTSFTVSYTLNICHFGVFDPTNGSLGDVIGGNSCHDDITTFITKNPLQSRQTSFNLESSTTLVKNQNIPDYLTVTGKNIIPIFYYLEYNMATAVMKWVEKNSSAYNIKTSCSITTTLSTSTSIKKIEIESQSGKYYYSINADNKNLDCKIRDPQINNASIDIIIRSYVGTSTVSEYTNFWTWTIKPEITHVGNLLIKNLSTTQFYCNYVNKYYVFSYSNHINTQSSLRYINSSGYFEPTTVTFESTDNSDVIIISPNDYTNPYLVVRKNELYDIVYVVRIGSTKTCSLKSFSFRGNNKHLSTLYPSLALEIKDYQPLINYSTVTAGLSMSELISTNTILFYPVASCSSSTNLQHCNLFAENFHKNSSINSIDLTKLVDSANTYISVKGIRWFLLGGSNANLSIDQYTGIMKINNPSNFFATDSININLLAIISDEKKRVDDSTPNNFVSVKYTLKPGYYPLINFTRTPIPAKTPSRINSLDLINALSTNHYCCRSDLCTAESAAASGITRLGSKQFICKYTLYPDIITTIPEILSSISNYLKVELQNTEYNTIITSNTKFKLDDTNFILYHVIDDNNYMTDRFKIKVTDKIGSIKCNTVSVTSPIPSGCNTSDTLFNFSQTLETYIYYVNSIRINVPDRQKVLTYYPTVDYSYELEINKPSDSGDITCECVSNNVNYGVSCMAKSSFENFHYNLKVSQILENYDPITITITCNTSAFNGNKVKYFGVNYFTLYPSLTVKNFDKFYLYEDVNLSSFSYTPSITWTKEEEFDVPNFVFTSKQTEFKPYLVYGEKLPYTFHSYNFKSNNPQWTTYQVINWNASSLRIKEDSNSFRYCCLESKNPLLKCKLKNTTTKIVTDGDTMNNCAFISPDTNNLLNNYSKSHKIWFDILECEKVDLNPGKNAVQCYDDLLTINCMPNLLDETKPYGYTFKHNIKICVKNTPLIKFLTATISSEFIPNINLIIDLTKFIDMRNILEGFVYSFVAKLPDNTLINLVQFNEITNIMTILSTQQSTIFPTNADYIFDFWLIDAYNRQSENKITFTLKLNQCNQFNQNNPHTLPGYWYPGYPKYNFAGYTNSIPLFDSAQTTNNIIQSLNHQVEIIKSPQLYRPPQISYIPTPNAFPKSRSISTGEKLVELWWDSPYENQNSYSNPVEFLLKLTCDSYFTPYYLTIKINYYPEIPFPDHLTNFKPFVKCIINSSILTFYNNSNNILSHFKTDLQSYSKITTVEHQYLNEKTNSATGLNYSQMQIINSSGFQINWTCQDNVNKDFTNIQISDTNLPYPMVKERNLITFKNKLYINLKTDHGHSFYTYYRIFPYKQINFEVVDDTFVTQSSLLAVKINFSNGDKPNHVLISTDTCNLAGLRLIDNLSNVAINMKSFYPYLSNYDHSDPTDPTIDTSRLCGLYYEPDQIFYIPSDYISDSFLNVKFTLFYYPHFGMESSSQILKIKKLTNLDLKFIAKVKDMEGNEIVVASDKKKIPTNILLAYGENLNNFMSINYQYDSTLMADSSFKFTPILNLSILNFENQLIYDANSKRYNNALASKIIYDYTNRIIKINFSKNQSNNLMDNYKATFHGFFTVKSHLTRFDYTFQSNGNLIKLYSEDLDNLKFDTNLPNYYFINSFYLNVALIPKRLYVEVFRIDDKTLTSTSLCTITDDNYYNSFSTDLSNYYNSNNPINISSCNFSTTNESNLILQFKLKNVSDVRDYNYIVSSNPLLDTCNINSGITNALIKGDTIYLDLAAAKLILTDASKNYEVNVVISHKLFNINTSTNTQYNYLKLQKIQQYINFKFSMTITRTIKKPKVQKFWSTSKYIYDSPATQFLWATENNQFIYNIKILADSDLNGANLIQVYAIDRHNPTSNNLMNFSLTSCSIISLSCPSDVKQQEDFNYKYLCEGRFSWTPNTYQFDTSLVVVKMIEATNSSLYNYYYFNVGMVAQQNSLPIINGIICKTIKYNDSKLTNKQLVDCNKQSNNFILVKNTPHLITLDWDDSDSYPINPIINSKTSYETENESILPLYPPQLEFILEIYPSIPTAFTILSYDTFKINLKPEHLNLIQANNNEIIVTYTINDFMWDVNINDNTNFIMYPSTPVIKQFIFSIENPLAKPFIVDSLNFASIYDPDYWLIPRFLTQSLLDLSYKNIFKYSFIFEINSDEFSTYPNADFDFLIKTNPVDCQNLKFETATGVDASSLTTTYNPSSLKPFQIKMTWLMSRSNNIFNTSNCRLDITSSKLQSDLIQINACQLFSCTSENIIYTITTNCDAVTKCKAGDTIILKGQNFPIDFTNGQKVMIGNSECNNPETQNSRTTVTCKLPKIGGQNLFVWLWNSKHYSNLALNSYPTYQITYTELFPSNTPIIIEYFLFKSPAFYFVNYPKPLVINGSNFRPSCQCVWVCNNVKLYPVTNVKSPSLLHCDYTKLIEASYLFLQCTVNISCLDHVTYKTNGNPYDYTNNTGDIIYTSSKSLNVIVDRINYNRVNFKGYSDTNLSEDYTDKSTFAPHRHGGYIIQITYDKIPECLSNTYSTTGCDINYFYIKISQYYVVKANCKIGNDGVNNNQFFCQFVSPAIKDEGTSYWILLSMDFGITFTDKDRSPPIELGTLCGPGYYCPAYKKIITSKGHFCDLDPLTENNSLYCKYQRKCPAGFYQDKTGQSNCIKVEAGYYLNYFGSDGENPPKKPCPKGYTCREEGLPKYYEICRPGHRCTDPKLSINNNDPYATNARISDEFCWHKNFCPLGVLFDKPQDYQNGTTTDTTTIADLFFPSTIYNYKDLQRLYSFAAGISPQVENYFISDLTSNKCKYEGICTDEDHFYDISNTRSKKGQYRPEIGCEVSNDPNVLALNNGMGLIGSELFKLTINSLEIQKYMSVNDDRYKFTCYHNPSCIDKNDYTCCSEGACWCPPGFGCDVEDLTAPILCPAGFWRLNHAYNNVAYIKAYLDANILNFLDPQTELFKTYSDYYMDKYQSTYIIERISDFYTPNTKCIICPPGYSCKRGVDRPSICKAGYYCEHQFSDAMKCKQGYYNDEEGQYQCKPCPVGKYCPIEGMSAPQKCPGGYYCPYTKTGTIDKTYSGGMFHIALECPDKYYCPEGSGQIGVECPVGHKCPPNSATPVPCNPGTFQNTTATSFCHDCPRGYYCMDAAMSQPKECDPGRICNSMKLSSSSRICTAGYICDGKIGLLPTDKTDLDYNSRYTARQMKPCDPGYYCNQGTVTSESRTGEITTPQKCNPPDYNPLSGQSKCFPCPAGSECKVAGLKNPVPCGKGFWRNNDPKLISCPSCKEGFFGDEIGLDSEDKCIPCPAGVVCLGLNLTTSVFTTLDERYWKLCPEGFICPVGTSLSVMNNISCPSGKFCLLGSQKSDDSLSCPAGRICPKGTAVSSYEQISTCESDNPEFCFVGDLCTSGYFCPPGASSYGIENSCLNFTSFTGARERFFCSRNSKKWDDLNIIRFLNNTPIWKESDIKLARILQVSNDQSSNNNIINSTNINSTNSTKSTNSNSTNETLIGDTEITCDTFSMKAFDSKIISFNMSKQNGFLPDFYDFIFTFNRSKYESTSFYLFDKEYHGSFGEVPLYIDVKYFLMKNDYKWKIKITAQDDITVKISIQYFLSAFYSPYYKNKFLFCSPPMVKVEDYFPEKDSLLIGKNLNNFFSLSKTWLTNNINYPNNMMYQTDLRNRQGNFFMAAVSLFTPTILDFTNATKFLKRDESVLNPKEDYYIHKSVQIMTTPDKNVVFETQPNIQAIFGNNDTQIYSDNIVTSYIPFISNCNELGTHITIMDMLKHPKCNLVSKEDAVSFTFANFFAQAKSDECDYSVSCFYDERFDSNKVNWMQHDYGVTKLPLMNISQYGIDSESFNNFVNDYYMKVPDMDTNDLKYTHLISQIPIKVTTEIGSKTSVENGGNYLPSNVTLVLLFYNDPYDESRKIIKASLELTNFTIIDNKDLAEANYRNFFNLKVESVNKLDYKIWQFFRDSKLNEYMGEIENYIFLNFYQKTTQFKENFGNYSDYQATGKQISGIQLQDEDLETIDLAKKLGDKPTLENLELWIKELSKKQFASSNSGNTIKYQLPPRIPLSPNNENQISPKEIYTQYFESYKDTMNNFYVLNKHFYNFRVVIRHATWVEALSYNAFSLSNYIISVILTMMIINIFILMYYLSYKVTKIGLFFKCKWNHFTDSKLQTMKFYEDYVDFGKSGLKALINIIKNNIIANCIVTIPTIVCVWIYIAFFVFSGIFTYFPAHHKQKSSDYESQKTSTKKDQAIEDMLDTNVTGRIGIAILSLGIFLFYLAAQKIKPPYPQEILEKNLVNEEQIKKKEIERMEIIFTIFVVMCFLFILTYQFTNFYILGETQELFLIMFYQIVVIPIAISIFEEDDSIILMIVTTLMVLNVYILLLSGKELNVRMIVFLINQILKFIRIFTQEKLTKFYKKIMEKTFLRGNEKQKLIDKIQNKDDVSDEAGDENETLALNSNSRTLSYICTEISLGFIIFPSIFIHISMMEFVYKFENERIFNSKILLILVGAGLIVDIINYYFIIEASRLKDTCFSMDSIYSESSYIYKERDTLWSLSSTLPINKHGEYRKYEKKFESIRRSGFSPQLFIINILFGLSFNLIYIGLNSIVLVKMLPWFDIYFFFFGLGYLILYLIIEKIIDKITNILKIWSTPEVEKKVLEKIRKLKEQREKCEQGEGDKKNLTELTEKTFDAIIAKMRNKIVDIWANDNIKLEDKKNYIHELLEEVKLASTMHAKSKKEINDELENKSKEDQELKKNKNFAGHKQSYDNIPLIGQYYSNLTLRNFNREVNLVMNEMTENRISNLIDLENRIKVRYDILNNLNIKMPDRFLEDIGEKERKKKSGDANDADGQLDVIEEEDEDNNQGIEEYMMNSKFEPTRPVFHTGLQTEVINNRRTTSKFKMTVDEN